MCSGFGTFHSFGKLSHSACWDLVQIYILITNGSGYKFFITQEKQKISLCKILAVSRGYLAKLTWAYTALYLSSTLLLPCLKLVRSKWACTSFDCGLQNSSNFPQIVSKVNSSAGKHHETYWSMPKSLLQASNHFLAFLTLRQCCKLKFQNILTLQAPLYKPMVKPIIYHPVHVRTFNVWHENAWN